MHLCAEWREIFIYRTSSLEVALSYSYSVILLLAAIQNISQQNHDDTETSQNMANSDLMPEVPWIQRTAEKALRMKFWDVQFEMGGDDTFKEFKKNSFFYFDRWDEGHLYLSFLRIYTDSK